VFYYAINNRLHILTIFKAQKCPPTEIKRNINSLLIISDISSLLAIYRTLMDAALLSCMNAIGRLNKAGIEQGYQHMRFK
jgi:hypothetical protein